MNFAKFEKFSGQKLQVKSQKIWKVDPETLPRKFSSPQTTFSSMTQPNTRLLSSGEESYTLPTLLQNDMMKIFWAEPPGQDSEILKVDLRVRPENLDDAKFHPGDKVKKLSEESLALRNRLFRLKRNFLRKNQKFFGFETNSI